MKALHAMVCSFLALGLVSCSIPEKNLAEVATDSNRDATGSPAVEQIEEQMPDLVHEAAEKFCAADFAYPELPDLANILLELPDEAYADIRWGSYKGDPCLILPYTDESLPLSPTTNTDGGFTDGYKEHEFYFDPYERCLRSYRVCITQFFTGFLDDGEPILVAPPNLYWNVFDFDYQPVALPAP